jgi:hypothetical protein
MTKTSRTNAVTTEGNNKIVREMLTGGRAGCDSCHALPRRTLNNLPPLVYVNKGETGLADAPINFLGF